MERRRHLQHEINLCNDALWLSQVPWTLTDLENLGSIEGQNLPMVGLLEFWGGTGPPTNRLAMDSTHDKSASFVTRRQRPLTIYFVPAPSREKHGS